MSTSGATIDPQLRVEQFSYDLPPELIAQTPLPRRDASRLMILERETGTVRHRAMVDLPTWLRPGDLLVANNSRVFPGRLVARKEESGGRVEVLLVRPGDDGTWEALAKPTRRLRAGTRLLVGDGNDGGVLPPAAMAVEEVLEDGRVRLSVPSTILERLDRYGEMPLPPYIRTDLADAERYQTVYGSAVGSAAAPTAGLHMTEGLLARLRERGVGWAEVTLHVGLDTFRPVSVERVAEHRIHREWCEVPDKTALAVAATRRCGGRIVALGTTSARTLETLAARWDETAPTGFAGSTELFIVPGYGWRLVDALLTNFHLPRSTLLMMLASFAGQGPLRRAYEAAIAERYRFFSFGDAMLVV